MRASASILALLALAVIALPAASVSASSSTVVGHAVARYTAHDVAVLTVDFVAYSEPLDPVYTTVKTACSIEAPQLSIRIRCTSGAGYVSGSSTFTGTGPVVRSVSSSTIHKAYGGTPQQAFACVEMLDTSIPKLCATRIL